MMRKARLEEVITEFESYEGYFQKEKKMLMINNIKKRLFLHFAQNNSILLFWYIFNADFYL